MTDEQIEKFIHNELKKKKVTFYDLVGLRHIDPDPDDKKTVANQRLRLNRFNGLFGSQRMMELLSVREYNPYDCLPPLKISLQDLFRFWWNRCVERDQVVADILEDIFTYFTEQMRPPKKKKKVLNLRLDFYQIPVSINDLNQVA